jgi:hypothetical protein
MAITITLHRTHYALGAEGRNYRRPPGVSGSLGHAQILLQQLMQKSEKYFMLDSYENLP